MASKLCSHLRSLFVHPGSSVLHVINTSRYDFSVEPHMPVHCGFKPLENYEAGQASKCKVSNLLFSEFNFDRGCRVLRLKVAHHLGFLWRARARLL